MLVIDAGADQEIGRKIWGSNLEHIDLPVRRNAVVTQVACQRFSKSALIGWEDISDKEARTVRNRLNKLRRFIRAQVTIHGQGRVLTVLNKPVRCAISGEKPNSKLSVSVEWEGATLAHFGNIKGIDNWKDYDAVIVPGREQLPPQVAEGHARALYGGGTEELHLPGEYEEQKRGYRMADGRHAGVDVWTHPDPRVQRLHERKRENEICQAIDRLRLIHREHPAEVYILGSLPVDVTVDRVVSLNDLLRETGVREAVHRRGVLPLSPDWIEKNEPELFAANAHGGKASESTIKRALRELGLTERVRGQSPNIDNIWSLTPYSVAFYRTEKRGHKRKALVLHGQPHPEAALADTLGKPVIDFELVEIQPAAAHIKESVPTVQPLKEEHTSVAEEAGVHVPTIRDLMNMPAGQVMPYRQVNLPVRSNIVVTPPISFPELAVWDEKGQFRGWNFGLPLPWELSQVA